MECELANANLDLSHRGERGELVFLHKKLTAYLRLKSRVEFDRESFCCAHLDQSLSGGATPAASHEHCTVAQSPAGGPPTA